MMLVKRGGPSAPIFSEEIYFIISAIMTNNANKLQIDLKTVYTLFPQFHLLMLDNLLMRE